jgi:hypothetical protein
MQYIDWIISSIVFLMIIVTVLNYIPENLPINDSSEDLFISNSIYNSINNITKTYNIIDTSNSNNTYDDNCNNTNVNINTYLLILDSNDYNYGISDSFSFIENNLVYGVLKDETNFYNIDKNLNNIGTLVFSENFNDNNYLDNLEVIDGNNPIITYEVLELDTNTNVSTINSFYDFNSTININCFNLNIYFNYIDSDSNHLKLVISGSKQDLYNCTTSTSCNLLDSNYSYKNTEWRKIYFGSTSNNSVFAIIDNLLLESDVDYNLNSGKIIIETVDEKTYIDDFKIYKNNDIYIDSDNNNILLNNFNFNIDNNIVNINLVNNKYNNIAGGFDFNLEDNIIIEDNNKDIKILKNNLEENKIILFPNTKEFWINIDNDEEIDFNFSNLDLNSLPYYIEDDNNEYIIWLKLNLEADSTKTIYISKNSNFDSNGDLVFEFFDNFEEDTLNTDKWNIHGSEYGTITTTNGELIISNTSGISENYIGISSSSNYIDTEKVLHTRSKITSNRHSTLIGFAESPFKPALHDDVLTNGTSWYGRADTQTSVISLGNDENNHSYSEMSHDPREYNTYDIQKISNSLIKYYKEDVLEYTFEDSNYIYSNPLPVYFSADGFADPSTIVADYVFVRKYTENEPSVSVSDLNNGIYKIEITNNESFDLNDFQVFFSGTDLNINNKTEKLQIIDLENNLDYNSIISINIFEQNKNDSNLCLFNYSESYLVINNCQSNVTLRIKNEINNLDNLFNYQNIKFTKYFSKNIFEEDLNNLNIENNYYLNIINKGTNLDYGTNINNSSKIIERYSNFIRNNLEKEIVKVLIKPY